MKYLSITYTSICPNLQTYHVRHLIGSSNILIGTPYVDNVVSVRNKVVTLVENNLIAMYSRLPQNTLDDEDKELVGFGNALAKISLGIERFGDLSEPHSYFNGTAGVAQCHSA